MQDDAEESGTEVCQLNTLAARHIRPVLSTYRQEHHLTCLVREFPAHEDQQYLLESGDRCIVFPMRAAISCSSWYKRDDGHITILYPYNAQTCRKRHRKIRPADFHLSN